MTDAVEARDIAQKRQRLEREAQNRRGGRGGTLEDIARALRRRARSARCGIIIKADQGGPAEALADALAQLSHRRGAGRCRAPRRRRHHRERHPARQGVGGHHHRLPRPARRQRPRRRRAGTGRCPDLSHHLRGRRGREERARRPAQAGGEGNRARRGRGAAALQGQQGRHHRRLPGAARHDHAHRQGPGDARRHPGLRRQAVEPQAVQGRREGSEGRPRVRHRHRELQRPQGRRRDRGLPGGGDQADPRRQQADS